METVNAPTFRLRRNGQIIGPLPRTRIRLMARRGEVALTDELSLNGGQWVPVANTPLAAEVTRKPAVTLGGASRAAPKSPPWPSQPPPAAIPRPAPVQAAPVHEAPAQNDDPLAGWESSGPTYTSRHTRRKVRRSDGPNMEVVLLGLFGVLALAAIVFAAFWFGRNQTSPEAAPAAGAARVTGNAVALPPASAAAFIGNQYGIWEAQGATAPTVRFRLLSNGRVEVVDSSISSIEEASTWFARWKVEGGVLTFVNAMGKDVDTFPDAQPRQKELVGAHFGRTWRKLTLENR